jgi:lipopolysaccharide export system protein LptC
MTDLALPLSHDRAHPLAAAEAWEPTRQLTLAAARKRSRQLSTMRLLFVGLATASFSTFFGFMTLHAALGGFGTRDEVSAAESLTMVNPRFSGRSQGGESFVVTALTAKRQGPQSDLIDLDKPVYTADGRKVVATAGVYNQAERTVQLTGEVVFSDTEGNAFSSTSAFVRTADNVVEGARAVRGEGPLGSVRADSYEIRDNGSRVIFRGHVKGTIKQRSDEGQGE